MANDTDHRYPHLRIVGGPTPGEVKIWRDGKELRSVMEFQINGGVDAPITATFREIVTFDGSIDLMPERKDVSTH